MDYFLIFTILTGLLTGTALSYRSLNLPVPKEVLTPVKIMLPIWVIWIICALVGVI